jgi:hypothetical protein
MRLSHLPGPNPCEALTGQPYLGPPQLDAKIIIAVNKIANLMTEILMMNFFMFYSFCFRDKANI